MQNNSISIRSKGESKRVGKMQKALYTALIITFTGISILSNISIEFVLFFLMACLIAAVGFFAAARFLKDDMAGFNEDIYANLINDNSAAGYIVYNATTGAFLFSSNSIEHVLGYTPFEMINKKDFFFFVDEHVKKELLQLIETNKETGGTVLHKAIRAKKKYDHLIWLDLEANILLGQAGKSYCLISFRDISDLKEKEHTQELYIKELEQMLRQNRHVVEPKPVEPKSEIADLILVHDLKEPLRNIVSYSKILQQKYYATLPEKGQEFLNYVLENGERVQQMFSDLISFSSIEKKGFVKENVDVGSIVEEVSDLLKLKIEASKGTLAYENLPNVQGDKVQLRHLFLNLIENGIKYTSDEHPPCINISYEELNGNILFRIKDNGIGIEREYQKDVFKVFCRLHSGDTFGGTGIGLAICKKIVELHEGRIWIESEGEGQGSTICFTLSACETIPRKAKTDNAEGLVIRNEEKEMYGRSVLF